MKECVNASLEHMNDDIAFDKENDLFQDFIEPDKLNNYELQSIPQKDFRMDAQAFDIAMNELDNGTTFDIRLIGYSGSSK